jgi:phosphoglycerol transferase MdoB-like AlkP superfamily enzyme
MSVYRLVFFLYYGKSVDLQGLSFDIFRAFYMGARFDLSALAGINAPIALIFIILLIIGQSAYFKRFFSFLKYYYTLFIGIVLILFCIDFNYYSYFNDHLNILIFGFFEDDTIALIKTFLQNYNLPLISLTIMGIGAGIFFLSKSVFKFKNYDFCFPKIYIRILISVFLPALVFFMIRGTFSWNTLGEYSDISSNSFINKTAINCIFTLQRAIEYKNNELQGIDYIAKTGYKNNIRQAFADFLDKDINEIPETDPQKSLVSKTANKKENMNPNVIVILMESFGGDLIKYNSAEFNILGKLKKHFDEDLVFQNFSSESTITIDAIEALFLNTMYRPEASVHLSQSQYAYKKYPFAATLPYKQNGYETFFIYGDNSGWRSVGIFALSSGFDKILSADLMKKDFPRGPWGVYDEYLFDLVFETLSMDNNKKFIFVLTTTNHPPYSLPKDYKKLPLEIPHNLKNKISDISNAQKSFATYQYANEMAGRFIAKIKNSKYADNTIIAITGDHSSLRYAANTPYDNMRVPFYLYIPKDLKAENINTAVLGSHLDIMPTLYNLSLSDTEYMSEGIDMLSQKALNNTMMYRDFIMNDKFVVKYDISKEIAKYYILDDENKFVESLETLEHKKLLRRFLSMTAISDYLINNCGN